MGKMLLLSGLPAEGAEALILSPPEAEVPAVSNACDGQHSALPHAPGDDAAPQERAVCKQSRFVTRYMLITASHLRLNRESLTRIPHMASTAPNKVDRHLTTPFLLKVFYKVNSFHRLDDFRAASQPTSFVEVYTWKDCSLSELATLLLSALPSLSTSATKCSFRLIYADTKTSRFTSSEIGNIILPLPKLVTTNGNGAGSSSNHVSSDKVSLDEVRFVVGDWIDVAIMTGSSSAPPVSNGIRIRGRGGSGVTGAMAQGDWRKGERLDDDSPTTRNEHNSSGPRDGTRRYAGGGASGSQVGGRRGSRW
ncbi:hypothetical protein ABW21_db0206259 [Orbilia brochopaga]|nr:hypothetical protein ABW21_db0206259 [Drechslerella brochopaga]